MALSETDRAALRGHWLGEPLPPDLAAVLEGTPQSAEDRGRRQELRAYQLSLAAEAVAQTRRLFLAYGSSAVARVVELMRGDNAETARKAAVDLLRYWGESAREELAAEASRAALDGRRLADGLTDAQSRDLLAILADAAGRREDRAPGDGSKGGQGGQGAGGDNGGE